MDYRIFPCTSSSCSIGSSSRGPTQGLGFRADIVTSNPLSSSVSVRGAVAQAHSCTQSSVRKMQPSAKGLVRVLGLLQYVCLGIQVRHIGK